MRKAILIIVLMFCVTLYFGTNATDSTIKAASKSTFAEDGSITILQQDSGINLSEMNVTFTGAPTYGSAQTVKFSAPKPKWKLEYVLIMATDGWNASSKHLPNPLPFAIEIRDANLSLLYHFGDTQLSYFTSDTGVRMANIEVPAMTMNGDFFVCFYGYRSLGLAAELQNATGNSYIFDKLTGKLYFGELPMKNNQTIPINWLIRIAGQ